VCRKFGGCAIRTKELLYTHLYNKSARPSHSWELLNHSASLRIKNSSGPTKTLNSIGVNWEGKSRERFVLANHCKLRTSPLSSLSECIITRWQNHSYLVAECAHLFSIRNSFNDMPWTWSVRIIFRLRPNHLPSTEFMISFREYSLPLLYSDHSASLSFWEMSFWDSSLSFLMHKQSDCFVRAWTHNPHDTTQSELISLEYPLSSSFLDNFAVALQIENVRWTHQRVEVRTSTYRKEQTRCVFRQNAINPLGWVLVRSLIIFLLYTIVVCSENQQWDNSKPRHFIKSLWFWLNSKKAFDKPGLRHPVFSISSLLWFSFQWPFFSSRVKKDLVQDCQTWSIFQALPANWAMGN
jgi:hypothetical protein